MEEIWKDVPNYEGYYQASNIGRVRSLDRTVVDSRGVKRLYKGRIIKGSVDKGYRKTTLVKDNVGRTYRFSQLVAMAFLDHKPNGHALVVDHINGVKTDDRVENLRIVSHRANTSTCFRSNEESFSSGYVGVNWDKKSSKWKAQIQHNGINTPLGYYNTEIEASTAYREALSKVKDGSFNPDDYKPKLTSKYKGVSFNKSSNKWVAQIWINGKRKHFGYFKTELEAHQAYQAKLKDIQTI